jgi:hypothetical protein
VGESRHSVIRVVTSVLLAAVLLLVPAMVEDVSVLAVSVVLKSEELVPLVPATVDEV